jgi:hypothetical protein
VILKKYWHDPVWSKVIAVAIVGLAGIAWASYRHWWSMIWLRITDVHAYMVSTTPVRHWVFGLLVLIAALFVMMVIGITVSTHQPEKNPFGNIVPVAVARPEWLSYTTDYFYELRWRWKYRDGDIKDLNAFCPRCDYQMVPTGISRLSQVSFRCDICPEGYEIRESYDAMMSVIPRRIQQRIRTGTYPKSQSSSL